MLIFAKNFFSEKQSQLQDSQLEICQTNKSP